MLNVKPLLGFIEVLNGTLDDSKPAANNTRWIFDVDGNLSPDVGIKIRLLDNRARRPLPLELFACVMTPESAAFYKAQPYFGVEDGALFISHAAPDVCSYRVMLDVMHSATR